MASPAIRYSSVPSTNVFCVMINTSEAERHKDDIADGIEARMRMQTSDNTGGIIFFGLNLCSEMNRENRYFSRVTLGSQRRTVADAISGGSERSSRTVILQIVKRKESILFIIILTFHLNLNQKL